MPDDRANFYKFVVPPTGVVVTLASVKDHGNITRSDKDTVIQDNIDAAVDCAERITGRLLRPATIEGFYNDARRSIYERWPYVPIERAPVTSVSAVNLWSSETKTFEALTSEQFEVKEKEIHWRVLLDTLNLNLNFGLPIDTLQPYLIRVDFIAGYATPANVPPKIKAAIRQFALWLTANPGDCLDENGTGLMVLKSALSAYTVRAVFA